MATILILDDEEGLRVTLQQTLELDGHVVVTSPNGKGAAQIVQSRKVDLLLTDLFMPDKEGLETIEELRGMYPDLPIIVMSGGGAGHKDLFFQIARQMGANATLAKPFSLEQLRDAVREVLGSRGSAKSPISPGGQ